MRSLMVVCLLIFSYSLCFSATLNVPGQYPTIQQAIDAAVNGDTILVASGTYAENISFKGKAIHVKGSSYLDTVIDGGQNNSVVTLNQGETNSSILENFKITNGIGRLYGGLRKGGGIYSDSPSNPKIMNVHITGNQADQGGGIYFGMHTVTRIFTSIIDNNISVQNGGGIYCFERSHPIISNSWISNNSAGSPSSQNASGGGIYCGYNSDLMIIGNYISGNTAFGGLYGGGGGICLNDPSGPNVVIENNIITQNSISYGFGSGILCTYVSGGGGLKIDTNIISCNSGGTGALYFTKAFDVLVINSLIFGNSSITGGGGIECKNCRHDSTFGLRSINSTFADNVAAYGSAGAFKLLDSTVKVHNSILWNNHNDTNYEVRLDGDFSGFNIDYSDVDGGQASCIGYGINWGNHMLDLNPEFVDYTNGDYHLSCISPCINRGSNSILPPSAMYTTDFDGDFRPVMGTMDMGYDEFSGTHLLSADIFSFKESTGGVVNLSLDAGSNNANRPYLILGSLLGTIPGMDLAEGVNLPINWDPFYTQAMLGLINTQFYQNFQGFLDGDGKATARHDTQGPVVGMGPATISFAYYLSSPIDFTSNPVNIDVEDDV